MTKSLPLRAAILTSVAFGALCAGAGTAQAQFKQTNLVSDISGLATITDPNLVNTWGVSALPGASPFWISNQGTGTSSLFSVTGSTGVAAANGFPNPPGPNTNFVAIPPGPGIGVGPTGQVANAPMTSFGIAGGPALFIFANLNGTISAWNGFNVNSATQNAATVVGGTAGAAYTGLAMNSAGNLLYAANGSGTGSIDVFNGSFAPTTVPGGFVDPTLPAGFVPFNVEDIGGKVYVAYAPAGHANQTGATAGMGLVAVFDESGNFQKNLVSAGGELASPWGMAIAPAGFGSFGGDLLVGNFSFVDSEINAFNATTGKFEGTIDINPGAGNAAGGLWDLMFGAGGPAGDPNTLFFTDGLNGETAGLFGSISVPEPSTWAMMLVGFGSLGLFVARRRRGVAIG
jgi:uncharacterized protein (TIGR03118 family)